ncbi:hypothetical protein [Shewanella algae]|uniref:Uncharacterized protein n=1 Tax=Shewanella algae TaxID=38313 RepID=A0AAD1NM46_9GAMM|nr:hypothetical protein [Shewanella algae]BCV44703.1 hypothetical protein TUM17379_17210 [Shewanella algae]
MIKQKYVGSLTVILGLWLLVVGQVLALSPEEKATAIIQASPAAQNIQRGFKSEYGSLYIFLLKDSQGKSARYLRSSMKDVMTPLFLQ